MKKAQKTIISAAIVAATMTVANPSLAANPEISCSSDAVFSQYSCNQCFEGQAIATGDKLENMSDDFANDGDLTQIIYKENQENPEMHALSDKVVLEAAPDEEDMWEFTEKFNSFFDEDEMGYIVPANTTFTWIQSPLGYGYKVNKNELSKGENAAMLVYNVKYRTIDEEGSVGMEEQSHNECVLYKSAEAAAPEVPTPEAPEKLPETGAESIFLGVFAMLAGLGLVAMRRRK